MKEHNARPYVLAETNWKSPIAPSASQVLSLLRSHVQNVEAPRPPSGNHQCVLNESDLYDGFNPEKNPFSTYIDLRRE